MLPERDDVGQALTVEQERVLLSECGESTSRALLPFVTLVAPDRGSIQHDPDTPVEQHRLRKPLPEVGKDKTAAGTGRSVALSPRAFETLRFWQELPDRQPGDFVFTSEKYGLHGSKGTFGGMSKFTTMTRRSLSEPSNRHGSRQRNEPSATALRAQTEHWSIGKSRR